MDKVLQALAGPLPGSQTRAIGGLALFAAVQLADASLTAMGISRFGIGVEANPLVAFSISTCGLTGLVGAKAVAVAGGAVLYARSRHLILAGLTVFSVFAAVLPWTWALVR
jgi:hypothetical protein